MEQQQHNKRHLLSSMKNDKARFFRFLAITHDDYREVAFWVPDLEDHLNKGIKNKLYGDQVKRVYFAPVLLQHPSNIHEEERYFNLTRKEISIKTFIEITPLLNLAETEFVYFIGGVLIDRLKQMEFVPTKLIEETERLITDFSGGKA